jgi:hypothetical protein
MYCSTRKEDGYTNSKKQKINRVFFSPLLCLRFCKFFFIFSSHACSLFRLKKGFAYLKCSDGEVYRWGQTWFEISNKRWLGGA